MVEVRVGFFANHCLEVSLALWVFSRYHRRVLALLHSLHHEAKPFLRFPPLEKQSSDFEILHFVQTLDPGPAINGTEGEFSIGSFKAWP